MDPSPKALIRLLVPRIPLILKTALLNALSWSKNSSKQDAKTEVAVVILRSMLQVRKPMRFLQKISTRDPGVKGPILVSKVTIPASSDDAIRNLVNKAIKELGSGLETYTLPELAAVEAEWNGYKAGVPPKEPRADLPESEHYKSLMETVSASTTILYFHGGAYFLMDPASHRQTAARLAKMTGMHHEPVAAKTIVFAGDSAGGNLAVALMLLLLTFQRMGVRHIKFHGAEVALELPGGVAVNSPWVDIGRSMPSIDNNAHFDYLDPPSAVGVSKGEPIPDDLWPASPPRAEIFCNASMMVHPLVSPLAAAPELWKGMPPTFMCLGNEGLEDEITVLARRMHQGGGVVEFAGYEGMPHCFGMIFANSPMTKDCFKRWARFCSDVTQGSGPRSSKVTWAKAFSHPPNHQEVEMDKISTLSDSDVLNSMKRRQEHAISREEEAVKRWSEQQSRAKL
ncbi:hypothetical protein H2202_001558 [Exophiala xenobiotica]|nr:hypothetical protein H2202_001558 [Exophiala xenobiotica]